MPETITRFMWGYQGHFRWSLELGIERIFKQLGLDHRPEVFLVGLRVEDDAPVHAACVEPEKHHWAESASMDRLASQVQEEVARTQAGRLFVSHPVAAERFAERQRCEATGRLVERHLRQSDSRPLGRRIFVAPAVRRDHHRVCVVVTVAEDILERIPGVASTGVVDHRGDTHHIPANLAEAALQEAFAEAARALMLPDGGADSSVLTDHEEALRRAAARLFSGLLSRGGFGQQGDTQQYAAMQTLSLAAYEKAHARGAVLFVGGAEETVSASLLVRFAKPLQLHDARGLRKVLSLSASGQAAVCAPAGIVGLAGHARTGDEQTGSPVLARFDGRGAWSIHAEGRELVRVVDGQPRVPKNEVDPVRLAPELRRRVAGLSVGSASAFARVAAALAGVDHGAVLVITPDAAAEAERLGGTALAVEPTELNEELALTFAGIDGATLCDGDGRVHAIGVILDGLATDRGDPARGARFNATQRYVLGDPGRRCAIVVSEDGGTTLLPTLKIAVHPNALRKALTRLSDLAAEGGDRHARREELAAMYRVHAFAHVLDERQCASANADIQKIETRFFAESNITMDRPPLKVDPGFEAARDLRDDAAVPGEHGVM